MVLEILWHALSCVKTSLDLGMGDITGDDDCAVEGDACGDRILGELLADLGYRLVKVYTHGIALACLTERLWDKLVRFVVHLLEPYTVLVYLGLDVTVGRA